MKNSQYDFSELNMTYSDCFFCKTNIPKHKDIHLSIVYDKDKNQILKIENLWHFCQEKIDPND